MWRCDVNVTVWRQCDASPLADLNLNFHALFTREATHGLSTSTDRNWMGGEGRGGNGVCLQINI